MMNDREFSNRKETLHGEFYENALKYPERIALIYENEKVSYKMLRLYALRAANYMWQGRLRYETYITDIKQVGMDQWTWRLTYKVFCGKNIVSTVDSLMSWNYQSVEKILNQLTKMHFRTAKLSETLLLAIKAR